MSDESRVSRRRFLSATGGLAGAMALAGCTGGGGSPTQTSTKTATATATATATPSSGGTETATATATAGNQQLALEAPDDKTLVVHLKSPFHSSLEMLAYSSFSAVPEGIVGDLPGYNGKMSYKEFSTKNPIGSGPFTFDKWTQGTEASVKKYGKYYGDAAKVDGVHWQIIEDDTASYNYAMNKNADLFGLPTSYYDPSKVSVDHIDSQGRKIGTYGPVRNGATVNYVGVPTINTFYIGFNMADVPKAVRQAFAYVVNQNLLVNEVFKHRGQAAYFFTPPSIYPGGANAYTEHAKNDYPYGYNQSLLGKAKDVMEAAGYGPDNKFEIQWTQYTSQTWLQMAQIIRDQISSAHVDMKIEQAPFSTLLQRGRTGNLQVYTLGWIADWPAPDNFLQLLNPPYTDTSKKAPISYLNWNSSDGSAAKKATDAWKVVENNLQPTDAAQKARDKAYVEIEDANWEDVGFINIFHEIDEGFWYDWFDYTPFGGMGGSRQKMNHVSLNNRPSGGNTVQLIAGTMTTMDPIAATDTESGRVIQNIFDALMNYPNGETNVEKLSAVDYSVSSDYKTYTFKIDPNATFHDGSPVRAQDFIYAFNRLAYSKNSRRAYFVLDSLGVAEQ